MATTDCEDEILDIEADFDARKSEPMTDEADKAGKAAKKGARAK
jgi:hypothetical protein